MKNITKFVALVAVGALAAVGLTGCKNEVAEVETVSTDLKFNVKYFHSNALDREADRQVYFIFDSDGTCSFRYYNSYYSEYYQMTLIDDYLVNLKYTFIDKNKEKIKCFFDSVEYFEDDNNKAVTPSRQYLLNVSENVVIAVNADGNTTFINENYLPAIPNFGKRQAL